jgi:ankyrin repeat protein
MNKRNRLTQYLFSGTARNLCLAAGVVVLLQMPAFAQYLPPSISLPPTLPGARKVLDSANKTQNSSNAQTTKTNAAQTPTTNSAVKSTASASSKTKDEAAISAARQGRTDSYKRMLDEGANPSAVDQSQSTALHYAAYHGDLILVTYLVAQKGVLIDARDNRGNTPAMLAAVADRDDVLRVLIKAGADVKLKGSDGGTMLHHAARKSNLAVVRTLLEFGANPKAIDSHGHTPSQLAEHGKKGQWEDTVKFLQAAENNP